MTAMPKPPSLPSDHLRPLLRTARRAVRFWWAGLVAFAVVGGGAAGGVLLWPRQYRSEASLHYREGMQWSSDEGVNVRRIGQRLREMALSRSQLSKAIEEMGLYRELVESGRMAEAVEEMRAATAFRFDQGDVFLISYGGETPEQAQKVTARLVEMLVAENRSLRSRQADVTREFLDAEKERKAADLAGKEGEQARFLARHPEFAQEQTTGVGVSLRARQRGGEEAAARAAEEAGLRAGRGAAAAPQDAGLVAAKNAAEARLTGALRELAERRSRLTEQHPDTKVAAANAAEAEQAYRRAVEALAASQGRSPAPPAAPRAAAAPAPAAQGRTVALETEWARLSREVIEARERLQQLDTQQFRATMTASMLEGGQAAQIVVIDPPYLPARPVGVRTHLLLLLALGAALAAGLAVAALLGLLDDLVYEPADVERLQIAPVLAEVPRGRLPRPGAGAAAGGGAAISGKDLEHPVALPRVLELAAFVARRRLALPPAGGSGADAGSRGEPPRSIVVSAAPAPRPAAAGEAEASPPPASALLVQMAEPGEGEGPRDPRVFSFVSDFAEPNGDGPGAGDGRGEADLVRIHRLAESGAVDERLVLLSAPDSPAASSFRVARNRLAERPGVKVVLVTSPRPSEGKTLAAANLALALGEGGRARVVLVEANYRTPSVARLFGFRPPLGIARQLEIHRERPEEPWDVVEAGAPWLHVLAASPDPDAGRALDGRGLAACIENLREAGYDHVVVDSSAILESADVNMIEEAVDGVIVTMWARRSRAQAFRKAAEQVGSGKLLGVVLLGT